MTSLRDRFSGPARSAEQNEQKVPPAQAASPHGRCQAGGRRQARALLLTAVLVAAAAGYGVVRD
jgi:hypothetical protein